MIWTCLAHEAVRAEAREARALTLVRLSRYEDAIVELQEGVRHAPDSFRLRYLLVLAFDRVGQKDRARSELELLQTDYPDSNQAQTLRIQPE